eukprot:9500926-Karenia_brevis.AAC.1
MNVLLRDAEGDATLSIGDDAVAASQHSLARATRCGRTDHPGVFGWRSSHGGLSAQCQRTRIR